MKASIVIIFFCMFTGSNARSSNCPTAQWLPAAFVGIVDKVVSTPVILDSSFSFFRNVMLFTEEEIAQVEEDAIQFYNTRFGLDFSQFTAGRTTTTYIHTYIHIRASTR